MISFEMQYYTSVGKKCTLDVEAPDLSIHLLCHTLQETFFSISVDAYYSLKINELIQSSQAGVYFLDSTPAKNNSA